MHLLLPLLASILFVTSLILIKRAGTESLGDRGVGPITTLFISNQFTAFVFSLLWFFGGTIPSYELLWQPFIIALLYTGGLAFTFAAIEVGDVSIATPVFGVKVVLVALLLTLLGQQALPTAVWLAAFMTAIGIALIQWTGRQQPRRVLTTILLAGLAATTYATFDVLVQRWAPAWGVGRFLPIVFWIVGIMSWLMAPRVQWDRMFKAPTRSFLFPAGLLIALQASCIVMTLAIFGDAARVNVVYALRALWSVLFAWAVAKKWGGAEAELGQNVMLTRLAGAALLSAAVALVVIGNG